jgi:hypothetical protein
VKKTWSIKWAYAWNIFGLADIILAISIVIYLNILAAANPIPVPGSILELAKFPYPLVTAFASPTIIFLHIAIFKKLSVFGRSRHHLAPAK